MELFEIYYHDEWRTPSSYKREHITSSAANTEQWLLKHLDDWYNNERDVEIYDVVEQGLNQAFTFMTVIKITLNGDGSVE
jgi:hypothetical protein